MTDDDQPTRLPVAYWVKQARAAIKATTATTCGHGVAPARCTDCKTTPEGD